MFGLKPKMINNHTKNELKRHQAGLYIEHPEELQNGTRVTVFQKGTSGKWPNGDGWWEHGEICTVNGIKEVNVFDGGYKFDQVEVYLTKYYA